ncbi:MAG: hypothetical protein IIW46_06475, partial [Bacteroidaceae bacterium]|nr:hypothetical protein [Bacteroidaceae bacterium]
MYDIFEKILQQRPISKKSRPCENFPRGNFNKVLDNFYEVLTFLPKVWRKNKGKATFHRSPLYAITKIQHFLSKC